MDEMEIPVGEAKARLTQLVRQAEAGEEVILTRHGRPVARLTAVAPQVTPANRRAVMEEVRARGRLRATPGPEAARSQDFLYDDAGLPR